MASKKIGTKVALGVGLGLAAAAASAGAYYFYGAKGAAGNRKKAAKWADDMRADVLKKAKKLQKLDEKAYRAIVTESSKAYSTLKSVDPREVAKAAAELKASFLNVKRELSRVESKGASVVRKEVRKVAKTTAKRVEAVAKKVKSAAKSATAKKAAKKKL